MVPHEKLFFDDPQLGAADLVAQVKIPILSIGLEDDPWGTRRAVSHFLNYHTSAPIEQRWYSPADTGGQPIGHLGFSVHDLHKVCGRK